MNIVPYEPEIHDDYVRYWWALRQGVEFPVDILPSTGYAALKDGSPVALLFRYDTNSSLCWATWPIASLELTQEERDKTLNALFGKLEKDARDLGYKKVFTTTSIPKVAERLIKLGYLQGDTEITQYLKEL